MTPNTLLPSILLSGPNRGGLFDWRLPQSWKCMIGWVWKEKNSTVESNNVILCSIYSCISSKNVICFSIFASLRLLCPALQLALLSVSCCDSRVIQGPPSKQAIWSITCKGDIFVSEPSPGLEAVPYPTPCDQM